MFTVNEYKIVFKRVWHQAPTAHEIDGSLIPGDGRYDTVCEIYVKDNIQAAVVMNGVQYKKVPSFTGVAKLHPNDQPDKIVGKKIALRNAIGVWFDYHKQWQYNCANFYNKEVRTAIWKAFWAWVSQWPNQAVSNNKAKPEDAHLYDRPQPLSKT